MKVCSVEGCDNPSRHRGWCGKHYTRWFRGQAMTDRERLLERFGDKYIPEPNSGCWLWVECTNNHGYGRFSIAGVSQGAHRVSWDLHCGPIPEGLHVLHKCDVRCCVNPDHLYLGTHKENMGDMAVRGRSGALRGEDNASAKLTKQQVLAIREDKRAQTEIAKDYGLTQVGISAIKTRKVWKHVS